MLRHLITSAVLVFATTGFVLAGEYTGKITSVKKDTMTIEINKKGGKTVEKSLTIKHTKGFRPTITGKNNRSLSVPDLADHVERSNGKDVWAKITTEGEGSKELATEIILVYKKP